jgi:hypothetical protein
MVVGLRHAVCDVRLAVSGMGYGVCGMRRKGFCLSTFSLSAFRLSAFISFVFEFYLIILIYYTV